MKVSGIYGDYDRTDYHQDSPYLIFLAIRLTINNPDKILA